MKTVEYSLGMWSIVDTETGDVVVRAPNHDGLHEERVKSATVGMDKPELLDPLDFKRRRELILDNTKNAVQKYVSGQSYGGVRLEIDNLQYADKPENFSLAKQREALDTDGYLSSRLRGDLTLYDEQTGEVIDKRKSYTVARVPYLTERGTFIHNGNSYFSAMQNRALPGVYTRRKKNGELESQFVLKPKTGKSFRIGFDAERSEYRLRVGQSSNVHLYSVLKDLGVGDEELAKRWGTEVLEANQKRYDKKALDRAFEKMVPDWQKEGIVDREQKIEALKNVFNMGRVSKKVVERNLPELLNRVKQASTRNELFEFEARLKSTGFYPDLDADSANLAFFTRHPHELLKEAKPRFSPDLEIAEDQWIAHGDGLVSLSNLDPTIRPEEDPRAFLVWFYRYAQGHKNKLVDEKQKNNWRRIKLIHGDAFKKHPTPRMALLLKSWAIDPIKLLPAQQREAFQLELEQFEQNQRHAKLT